LSERYDHLLREVPVIAVCGMPVGGESFYDMEDFCSSGIGVSVPQLGQRA
jgi:hypothetical protein